MTFSARMAGCVKSCPTALRNAKQFGSERSCHRPMPPHRLFVEAPHRLMGCDKRPLDAVGEKADERFIDGDLSIDRKLDDKRSQQSIIGRGQGLPEVEISSADTARMREARSRMATGNDVSGERDVMST